MNKKKQNVLITGASGYIGGRLIPYLKNKEYNIFVMVRKMTPQLLERWPNTKILEADALDLDSILNVLKGIDIAYYLIHSMQLGKKNFEEVDLKAAKNFREAAEYNEVKRIIYLDLIIT